MRAASVEPRARSSPVWRYIAAISRMPNYSALFYLRCTLRELCLALLRGRARHIGSDARAPRRLRDFIDRPLAAGGCKASVPASADRMAAIRKLIRTLAHVMDRPSRFAAGKMKLLR